MALNRSAKELRRVVLLSLAKALRKIVKQSKGSDLLGEAMEVHSPDWLWHSNEKQWRWDESPRTAGAKKCCVE